MSGVRRRESGQSAGQSGEGTGQSGKAAKAWGVRSSAGGHCDPRRSASTGLQLIGQYLYESNRMATF